MRAVPVFLAKALGAAAAAALVGAPSSTLAAASGSSCDAASFAYLKGDKSIIPGAEIVDVEASLLKNHKLAAAPPYFPQEAAITACALTATYVHPATNATPIHVTVWLPPKDSWNGRFNGNGGGGWQCSFGPEAMGGGSQAGFATAITDGGLSGLPFHVDYPLLSPGNPDLMSLARLGHRAVHEMTLLAKRAINGYYGRPAQTSYYVGCSTGGRQGLMEASRFPEDYDGYLLGAPAARWSIMVGKILSEAVAMHHFNSYPSECEIDAIVEAAVEACDTLDGRADGIISRPDLCTFTAVRAIGRPYADYCDSQGAVRTVSDGAARVAQLAVDGPFVSSGRRLGPGFPWGTNITDGLTSTARTVIDPATGKRTPAIFPLSKQWYEEYVLQGLRTIDFETLTFDEIDALGKQSQEMYNWFMEPSNDLSRARDRGSKFMLFHGMEDSIIPVGNSVLKHDEIRQATYPHIRRNNKALEAMQSFFRIFLVPGMSHCVPSPARAGNPPSVGGNAFQQLVMWVEGGIAPERLKTDGAMSEVCLWPQVPYWTKNGQHLECRSSESFLTHLASRLPRLGDLPVMFMEVLPRMLFLDPKVGQAKSESARGSKQEL